MRYIYWLVFVFGFASISEAQPYTAVITADGVAVRCGPGTEFYPTLHLRADDKVEIYHEQGEWCAIRPPIGSFSWISAKFVEFGSGNIGTVLADELASHIGSAYSDDCGTVQVTLKKGEAVLILERRETPENFASPIWLKIAPPNGEFRWIHRSVLQPTIQQVQHNAVTTNVAATPIKPTEVPALPKVASAHPFPATQRTATNTSTVAPFQRAFNELQRETYIVMTRPADDDVFAVLIQRAHELHQIAPTDHDLEKTYHVLESLQRTRAVRRELTLRRPATVGVNQSFSAPNSGAMATSGTPAPQQSILPAYTPTSAQIPLRAGVNVGGYDIVGLLGEFDPLPPGHPPFAIADEKGQVICLISPSANLDLSSHVGQFVGINGVFGFDTGQRGKLPARHITALQIRTLR